MKKIIAAFSLMVLSLFFTGCEKTIDLTDEENRIIAEYAAELLLKYDRNLDSKYYDSIEEADRDDIDVTEISTEGEPQDEETTEEITTEESTGSTAEDSFSTTESDASSTEENIMSAEEFDLGEFIGSSDISIHYSYYMIVDSYPSYDKDGVYIEIEAPEGYKLLVLKFDIENLTDRNQNVDLYAKDMGYYIIINDGKMAKQMLTILLDDLYTYQGELAGNARQEAVLIFQMSDSVAQTVKDLKLRVKSADREQTISLN